MNDFEQTIGATFEAYAEAQIANLAFMPVPTRMVMLHGKPVRVQTGKAPFDVYGFARRSFDFTQENKLSAAIFIGAELKSTTARETSIRIVGPTQDGAGVEYHQLSALCEVVTAGGVGLIVWNNGGEIGVLHGTSLLVALDAYDRAMASEASGKGKGPLGSRSLPWQAFHAVNYHSIGGRPIMDWLVLPWW